MKLTTAQKKAVTATQGNILVHAGSGAGKTSAFVARIANLIKNENVDPESILGLTFTKEAAENMKSRLSGHIPQEKIDKIKLTTFHSFAYGLMKSKYPGTYKRKTLMKTWWRTSKLWDIKGSLDLTIDGSTLGGFISYQKTNMVKEGMPIKHAHKWETANDTPTLLQSAFDLYCKEVRQNRLFEFDDMIVDLFYKLSEDESLVKELKKQYKYVMVDEFQDTNTANMEILKLITDNNLFVVGDFRQGIYGFINASIDNILNFANEFEDVKLIELNENFRSTDKIVDFANKIIESSPEEKYKQFSPQVAARGVKGDGVKVVMHKYDTEEIDSIINRIHEVMDEEGYEFSDFAILLRTNTQLGLYESAFANDNIPVDVSSSRSFFDRKEIGDILAYARHTIDQTDDPSITRIANSPNRYIKKDSTKNVVKYAYDNDITFEEACRAYNKEQAANFRKIASLFDYLRAEVDELPVGKFLELIVKKTGYIDHIIKNARSEEESELKQDAIDKLIHMANMRSYKSVESFLDHISIIEQNSQKSNGGVKIMTVHSSKGLEFPFVFVPSVSEENYPHDMNPDYEEERRLFYVACTRAKDYMEISAPIFSKTSEGASYAPSPFLSDVMGNKLFDMRKSITRDEADIQQVSL